MASSTCPGIATTTSASLESGSPSPSALNHTKERRLTVVSLLFISLIALVPAVLPLGLHIQGATRKTISSLIVSPLSVPSTQSLSTNSITDYRTPKKTSANQVGLFVSNKSFMEEAVNVSRPRFVTLSFNFGPVRPMVEHNCAMLSRAGYEFDIYTDNTTQPHCSTCNCIHFERSHCRCPQPDRFDCSLCEKLFFLSQQMKNLPEFVFIDSDLIILREEFMAALVARTRHFDFLATYGFGRYDKWHYNAPFNSGLMFIRRLDGIDYSKMIDMMQEMGNNNDQNVISVFVRKYYTRWDSLSLKWHCRYLHRPEHSIKFEDCFTFHGRYSSFKTVLRGKKFSYLHTHA